MESKNHSQKFRRLGLTTPGCLTRGAALMGTNKSGRSMSFVAMALSAPVSTLVYGHFGFISIAILAVLLPFVALPLLTLPHYVHPLKNPIRTPLLEVFQIV